MITDFWEIMLDPVFLFMTALVLLPFGALLYSVWITWLENTGDADLDD